MKKIHRLKWEPSYSMNNETIDAEHRRLFAIVNDVRGFYERGSGNLLPVISDLVDYLTYHLNSEHMIMMSMDYPGFFDHNNDHQRFTEKIHEFLKKLF